MRKIIKGELMLDEDGNLITECFCDPCGDPDCGCWYKRCGFCLEADE